MVGLHLSERRFGILCAFGDLDYWQIFELDPIQYLAQSQKYAPGTFRESSTFNRSGIYKYYLNISFLLNLKGYLYKIYL
jgi:hypothetical protein